MIDLGLLVLLRPLWLLALPALALAFWLARRTGRRSRWSRIVDAELLPVLAGLGHVVSGRARGTAPLLAATGAALALALSGPALRDEAAPAFRNTDAIVLAIDMSDSVVKGGGLDDAQAAAARVLAEAGGRPVSLVLYSGESYAVGGPTEDPMTLQSVLAVLDRETMPVGGSRPDRALALAREALAEASARDADVLLVSDGGGIGPEALLEAELLSRELGARVSALFVAPASRDYGAPEPDRAALQALVDAGGGTLADVLRPDLLLRRMSGGSGSTARDERLTALLFEDYGRWLLLLALPPAVLLFRRRVRA